MRKINYADHLEENIGLALDSANIEFVHESENHAQVLDFYLPKQDVYIEVKQFHAQRISRQMESAENVIALQGKKSVDFFIEKINSQEKSAPLFDGFWERLHSLIEKDCMSEEEKELMLHICKSRIKNK